jgi:hypothetical protein
VTIGTSGVTIYIDGVKNASSSSITLRPSDVTPTMNYLGRSQFAADPAFNVDKAAIQAILKPENYVGRAPRQTEEYLESVIRPLLAENADDLGLTAEINV